MSRPTLDEYRAKLRTLPNSELVDKTGSEILGAVILEVHGRGGGWADECVSACYDEAKRRGNPDLYERGYRMALRSQGHEASREPLMSLSVGEPEEAEGK